MARSVAKVKCVLFTNCKLICSTSVVSTCIMRTMYMLPLKTASAVADAPLSAISGRLSNHAGWINYDKSWQHQLEQ